MALRDGRRGLAGFRRMGRPGLVVTLCSGCATILFINALRRTSVAEAMIISATIPLATAAIGWAAFGIRESRVTLAASALAALWVWLAFAETPRWSTLAGGAVVLAAVAWHLRGGVVPTARAPALR